MSADSPEKEGASQDRPALITWARPAYRVVRASVRAYLRTLHRLRVEEERHLPTSGGVMIVSNHQSFLDIPILASSTSRHLSFVARDTLARSRPLAWLMRECGAVLIKRGSSDRAALREMVEHLRLGDGVVVFPEGTRTRDGSLGEFRAGALFAAQKAGVPVVPVGIRGAMDALGRDHLLPRPFRRVAVRFGAPLEATGSDAMGAVRDAVADLVGDGHFEPQPAATPTDPPRDPVRRTDRSAGSS